MNTGKITEVSSMSEAGSMPLISGKRQTPFPDDKKLEKPKRSYVRIDDAQRIELLRMVIPSFVKVVG